MSFQPNPNYMSPDYPTVPQPPLVPGRPFSGWRANLLMGGVTILAFAAAFAIWVGVTGWNATVHLTTQSRHLTSRVNSLQTQLGAANKALRDLQAKQIKDYRAVTSDLVPLVQYGQVVCSTDLNGPKGPAQYWFLCTSQKPSSSTG